MKLRRAKPADLPAIKKLLREHRGKLMQNHLPKIGSFYVAEVDGEVIGCCALDVYSKRLAEIRSLAVTREFQGQGIARALVEVCMKEARKKKIYEVIAISGADKFFAKFGFHTFKHERFALINILG